MYLTPLLTPRLTLYVPQAVFCTQNLLPDDDGSAVPSHTSTEAIHADADGPVVDPAVGQVLAGCFCVLMRIEAHRPESPVQVEGQGRGRR